MSTHSINRRDTAPSARRLRRLSAGFTLIELMIAMLLGLIVIAGVASVFLATQRSYRTNDALGDVQDGSRIAFELMARDIRDAGLTGCNNNGRVANVLNPVAANWWANWGNAVHGYGGTDADPGVAFGTTAGTRVKTTDSLMLLGASNTALSIASANQASASFKLNDKTTDLNAGDLIMVCDPDHATIVQITNYNNSSVTVVHNTGGSTSPGNCSKGLGYPTDCTSTNGNSYQFGPNSQMFKLAAVDWYIGTNAGGGRSLYRMEGAPTLTAQEMVRGVTGMAVSYHQPDGTTPAAFVLPASVTNWSTVDAVQVTLTLQSTDQRAGTDVKPLTRTFTATTTIRNRVN